MSLFLGDPSPNSTGADIERLRRVLELRRRMQEEEQRSASLDDVLGELRTLNNTINERLRVPQNTMSPA